MKAITIIQPWATLIAIGAKRVETRSWGTRYRGPIAIHAGKKVDKDAYWDYEDEMLRAGYILPDLLPVGSVIATATLADCVPMTREWIYEQSSNELEYGFFMPGRYGWILTDVRPIRPIPQRGYQGLWDWEATDEA